MTLLRLPPELLSCVLEYLGSEFFIQDVRRLSVSKLWYQFAWKILVRDLKLTARSLDKFTEDEAIQTRSRAHITTVELSLTGYEGETTQVGDASPADEGDDGFIRIFNDHLERVVREWIEDLNVSLTALAVTLQQCPRLRCLKFRARPGPPMRHVDRTAYLMMKPLGDLLSVCHLTSLDLDTGGSLRLGKPGDSPHLCLLINAFLRRRSMRRLRCRVDRICRRLLRVPSSDTPSNLEEVILNLSIPNPLPHFTSRCHPINCQYVQLVPPEMRIAGFEYQMVKLSHGASNPRMFRVISHRSQPLDIFAFDAVTGRRVRLKSGAEWDAEGEVVDEGNRAADGIGLN